MRIANGIPEKMTLNKNIKEKIPFQNLLEVKKISIINSQTKEISPEKLETALNQIYLQTQINRFTFIFGFIAMVGTIYFYSWEIKEILGDFIRLFFPKG